MVADDKANREKQKVDKQVALDAMERYYKSIQLQMELKDSSQIILDSMRRSLGAQRLLLNSTKSIQGQTSVILGLQDQSLVQQQAINLNTQRILTPLFPMEIAVSVRIHQRDMTPEQQNAFREIKEQIEAGTVIPKFAQYADREKTNLIEFSADNIFTENPSDQYYALKGQLQHFEPAMLLHFNHKKAKPQKQASSLDIRFSRKVNNEVIPHKSFATFNFREATLQVHLSLNQVENATNNDNYVSVLDLKGGKLRIEPFLGRRKNHVMEITEFRMSTGHKAFKSIFFRLKPEEKTQEGYVHTITNKELAL